ncbi:hypothetical protein SOVF_095550 [Spinacia oleracea]|nr:hypothetical protein SOVF_095550 [Spinacia oleracea]
MKEVKASAAWVASQASHVFIDSSELEKVVEKTKDAIPKVEWDYEGIHYFDDGPLSIQYLLVLDSLNFCFWPGGVAKRCDYYYVHVIFCMSHQKDRQLICDVHVIFKSKFFP